jgi:ATP-dependent helicase/nuclease subunit B
VVSVTGRLTEAEADIAHAKDWKRKGLLLSDLDVISAMQPEGSASRLNYKIDKNGELSGDVASREQLNLLRRYVQRVLQKLIAQIAQGNVEPNPYCRGKSHNACTYCPYKAVCHYDRVPGRRNYMTMSAQRFWDEIGKEMAHRG